MQFVVHISNFILQTSIGLHEDKFGRKGLEDFRGIITIGGGINEQMFASFCVKIAAHGIDSDT